MCETAKTDRMVEFEELFFFGAGEKWDTQKRKKERDRHRDCEISMQTVVTVCTVVKHSHCTNRQDRQMDKHRGHRDRDRE